MRVRPASVRLTPSAHQRRWMQEGAATAGRDVQRAAFRAAFVVVYVPREQEVRARVKIETQGLDHVGAARAGAAEAEQRIGEQDPGAGVDVLPRPLQKIVFLARIDALSCRSMPYKSMPGVSGSTK